MTLKIAMMRALKEWQIVAMIAFTFILGFFPPTQLEIGGLLFYEIFLIGGVVIFCGIPMLIYQFRKPEWKSKIHT